ncbi:MAG: gliding motility-associated C-terminal domain-containing protein [Bacteroidales bacterium]|nr:gliding motility-associated C-terminal domain-containing protein [Bacteroidales bacterium]
MPSPVVFLGNDRTFCNGTGSALLNAMNPGSTYLWQDNSTNSTFNATTPGIYYVEVSNGQCTSSDTIQIFPHSGFVTSHQFNNVNCFDGSDGTISIITQSDYPPYSFEWSNGMFGASISNLPIGTYYVTITDANGCTDLDSATLVQPTAIDLNETLTGISCYNGDDGAIDVIANGGVSPYIYTWNNGVTGTNNSGLSFGNYFVSVTDQHNCLFTKEIYLSNAQKIVTSLPDDHFYCSEDFEQLNSSSTGGNAPYTYLWNDGSQTELILVSPIKDTTYFVTVTDSKGCTTEDHVKIWVYPELEIFVGLTDDTICFGESSRLGIDAFGGSGSPYEIKVNGQISAQELNLHPESDMQYIVELSDACYHTKTQVIDLKVMPLPEVDFTVDINQACEPLTSEFFYTKTCENCEYLWEFSDGVNTPNIEIGSQPIHIFDDGLYAVKLNVKDQYGCKNEALKHNYILAYPKPIAQVSANPLTASIIKAEIQFENKSIGSNASQWDFNDGQSSLENQPVHNFENPGFYNVQLIAISDRNCTDTNFVLIEIKDEVTFYAPESFTPDNDNINEVFRVYGNGISKDQFSLQVYDRWGQVLYSSSDINEGWNGKHFNSDKYVKNGNYVWVCQFKDIFGIMHEEKGTINLSN